MRALTAVVELLEVTQREAGRLEHRRDAIGHFHGRRNSGVSRQRLDLDVLLATAAVTLHVIADVNNGEAFVGKQHLNATCQRYIEKLC